MEKGERRKEKCERERGERERGEREREPNWDLVRKSN